MKVKRLLRDRNKSFIRPPAHENTGNDINKCTEEAAVLPLVQEETEPVDLGGRDDKHDNTNKDGEVAVSLASPVDNKLTILLPPLSSCKQKTMSLFNENIFGQQNFFTSDSYTWKFSWCIDIGMVMHSDRIAAMQYPDN